MCYVMGIGLFWFDCLVLGLLAEWRWCHGIPFVSSFSLCFCCLNCWAFCLVVIRIILCRKTVFPCFHLSDYVFWNLLIKRMLNNGNKMCIECTDHPQREEYKMMLFLFRLLLKNWWFTFMVELKNCKYFFSFSMTKNGNPLKHSCDFCISVDLLEEKNSVFLYSF